jgi:AraC-like DNA-binding protein
VDSSKAKRFGALPSAGGGIARLAYARARAAGIELEPLLKKAGLTDRQIEDRHARLNVQDQIRFLNLAADALQDEFLGFHLAQDFELGEVGVLYYVLASSALLSDALRRAERYSVIANEGVSVKYREGADIAIVFDYVGVSRHSDRHQIEFWIATLIRICRHLTNHRLLPIRVKVRHRRNEDSSEFDRFLGRRAMFGADVDEVVFSEAAKRMPITSADPHLNELLTAYCEEALSRRRTKCGMLQSHVENVIVPLLPHGEARVDKVARRLGMSQRTLARRLSSEGLTFAGVLDRLRSDLATSYLGDADLSISQVAWLLGYREVSAFTHAFKRRTGMTPRDMRSRNNVDPSDWERDRETRGT